MALKDKFRRAIGRFSPSNSESNLSSDSSSTTDAPSWRSAPEYQPSTPFYTLTKSSSRLTLSKAFTFATHKSSEIEKARKKEKKRQKDLDIEPRSKYPGDGGRKHQDMLRAFEFRFRDESAVKGEDYAGRRWSVYSGISPGTSRCGSLDEGPRGRERGEDVGLLMSYDN